MTFLSIAVLMVLGGASLVVLRALPANLPHAIAASVAAGAVLLAIVGTTVLSLGLRLSIVPVYALAALLLVVAARRRGPIPHATLPRDHVALVLVAVAGITLLAIAGASLHDRLWWDGWAIWALKGRVLFHDGQLSAAFMDTSGPWAFTHLDYPLAVPLIDWWGFAHAGTAAPEIASIFGVLWFTLLPLLAWAGVARHSGERVAAFAALGITLFWPIAYYATGGTADVLIAVALLGVVVELDRAVAHDDAGALPRLALFLSLAALTKNEGLAIALLTAPIATLATSRARRVPAVRLAWLLMPFAALAPWWWYVSAHGLRADAIALDALPAVAGRLTAFAAGVGTLFTSFAWVLLPAIAIIGIIAALRRRAPGITAGWLVVGMYFVAIAAAYALSPEEIGWLLTTSLPRVIGALVPAVVLLSAAATSNVEVGA